MDKLIKVTTHAVEKYLSEMIKLNHSFKPKDPEKDILHMFNNAKREQWTPGLVKRIIDNRFEESEYYRYGNWRFVVCNGVIVTVERNLFPRPQLLSARTRRQRKYRWKKGKK